VPDSAYIVRAAPGELIPVLDDVRRLGGTVRHKLDLIDAAAVTLPDSAATALLDNPRVVQVTPDAKVRLLGTKRSELSSDYDAAGDVNSMHNVGRLIGARHLWKSGITGKGIDVALIDSGVAPVTGLSDKGKVVNGPDLTPESQKANTRYLDTFGHGTHMAGIIAGRDPRVDPVSAAKDSGPFLGVAPDARIVSVKVADVQGATDVSQVIAGIGWVVQHANDPGLNIRVLNLSFGTDSAQSYVYDPLAYAAEVAWRRGIVVVASAGNSGFENGRLTNPAMNPFLLAVGASDTKGTYHTLDDTIPSFSSRGDGVRNPDIVAPGVSVQSLRVPGSYIDVAYGVTGRLGDRFFRGSGTSQSAAVTSGAVALLLQQRPWLTPDQVKLAVARLGARLVMADPRAQGNGLLDLRNAATLALLPALPQAFVAGTGTGSLDKARGSARLVLDGVVLDGERDIFGMRFDSAAMARKEAQAASWSGGHWNGSTWSGSTWRPFGWATVVWTRKTWAGGRWSGRTWASGTWNGQTWANSNWGGRTWAGADWAGRTWAGRTWAGRTWAGTDWAGGDWQ
jgi:serine protease AprX